MPSLRNAEGVPVDVSEAERAAFVACTSHRARERVLGVIGHNRQCYYICLGSPYQINHKGIYPVTRDELRQLKRAQGEHAWFRVPRAPAREMGRCWS